MTDLPIINARRQLAWRRRIVSDLATVALWAGWILLWIPSFQRLRTAIHLHLHFGLAAREVLETVAPIPLTRAALLVFGTCGLLLLWTLVPSRRPTEPPATETLEDEAARLRVPTEQLRAGRAARIDVVHHDEAGNIIGIDAVG